MAKSTGPGYGLGKLSGIRSLLGTRSSEQLLQDMKDEREYKQITILALTTTRGHEKAAELSKKYTNTQFFVCGLDNKSYPVGNPDMVYVDADTDIDDSLLKEILAWKGEFVKWRAGNWIVATRWDL